VSTESNSKILSNQQFLLTIRRSKRQKAVCEQLEERSEAAKSGEVSNKQPIGCEQSEEWQIMRLRFL
jgi:hypothetical protein